MTAPRPGRWEIVATTVDVLAGDVVQSQQTVYHARYRATGNLRVITWSENYPRRARAVRAIELQPGVRDIRQAPSSAYPVPTLEAVYIDEVVEIRDVDAR